MPRQPDRTQKKDTPIEGRITAVADVYDALSSARPYKKAFSRDKCFRILKEGRGSHFDPNVLDAFFRRTDDITEIQLRFSDRA
jgi:putative two-component system response regulator